MDNKKFKTLLNKHKNNDMMLFYEYYTEEAKGDKISYSAFREIFPEWLISMNITEIARGLHPVEIKIKATIKLKEYLIKKHT